MCNSILTSTISFLVASLCVLTSRAQDTFSIVAVDSVTGEVGSAGASCVDLFQTSLANDDFLGVLIPGVGAINTQAYYLPANQNNATNRMNLGDTPNEIIQWLVANDIQGNPTIRQYGIAALINGSPQTAAHTGSSTDDYKNHIVGPYYSIQGNILLGQEVLDSMETRFLNKEGDLACKLMAALQGANMIGADTRCATNGTSSLFAFVKVSQASDPVGSPSFLASVRTHGNDGLEPIDSLQILFDQQHACGGAGLELIENDEMLQLFPNPTENNMTVTLAQAGNYKFEVLQLDGTLILEGTIEEQALIELSSFKTGYYLLRIHLDENTVTRKFAKFNQ